MSASSNSFWYSLRFALSKSFSCLRFLTSVLAVERLKTMMILKLDPFSFETYSICVFLRASLRFSISSPSSLLVFCNSDISWVFCSEHVTDASLSVFIFSVLSIFGKEICSQSWLTHFWPRITCELHMNDCIPNTNATCLPSINDVFMNYPKSVGLLFYNSGQQIGEIDLDSEHIGSENLCSQIRSIYTYLCDCLFSWEIWKTSLIIGRHVNSLIKWLFKSW